jgi:hypothetical protein
MADEIADGDKASEDDHPLENVSTVFGVQLFLPWLFLPHSVLLDFIVNPAEFSVNQRTCRVAHVLFANRAFVAVQASLPIPSQLVTFRWSISSPVPRSAKRRCQIYGTGPVSRAFDTVSRHRMSGDLTRF